MRYYFTCLLILTFLSAFAQVTSRDGLEIFVQDTGAGDTTLLFIHGWNLDHSFWKYQVDEFSDNYRCVAPDLPGYGDSGKSRSMWTMKAYGSDIREIIDQLDLKHVVLIAHSMGGNIALETLMLDPSGIIGIVGVDNFKEAGTLPDSATQYQMEQFYQMLEDNYAVNVRMAAEGFMFHPESPAGPKEEILTAYAATDPSVAIPIVKAAFTESELEAAQLARISIPFTLISSTNIPFNQEMFLNHYNGERFRNFEMEGTGHFPMYEDPPAFNNSLEQALEFMFKQQE
jgi:pimeloyl-ACP methyl ester carboxylesterase